MRIRITLIFLMFLGCWTVLCLSSAGAEGTTLRQSVEQAFDYSPQLKAMHHDYDAIGYDLMQSRANYRPTIDLVLGYGLEQHSDDTTRSTDANPSDSDWDPRNDATLRLTQKLYDGGETGQQVSIQEASRDSAHYRLYAAAQSVALNAIMAHLEIYLQRELVTLARNNLKFHQNIHQLLAEREQAGAGSIADVTQTQARLARAESNLYISMADLTKALANYLRVVGIEPLEVDYAEVPETAVPKTLEEALARTEQYNPELLAHNANLVEAGARVKLARSNYKPKVNIELSSRYNDQLEGNSSWQHTNDAMVVMRWNLYKGGHDRAGEKAALSRKYQSRSNRDDRILELREATSTAWATHASLQRQKDAYGDATTYSRKTLEAYLRQFNVSKRSLLDVLSAANDYTQSASQLITVTVNKTIAAYRLLKLGGMIQIPAHSKMLQKIDDLSRLAQAIDFPDTFEADQTQEAALPDSVLESTEIDIYHVPAMAAETKPSLEPSLHFSIEIGPCINKRELKQAAGILKQQGIGAHQISGSGPVTFFRLLEGVYPSAEARQRLRELRKTVDSAFVASEDGQLALFAGSFRKAERADRLTQLLEQKQIMVTKVVRKIEKQGTLLVVEGVQQQTAETIAEQMSLLSLSANLIPADHE